MTAPDVRSRLAAEVPGLLRYARTITADASLAEDLVQETMLRALQRAESFRAEASLATWLHRILHNLAVDRFRADREDATEVIVREVEEKWRGDSYSVDAATVVERAQTREELEDALVRLPVIYRTAVVLHDAEGITVAEIADIQDVGLPAAKQRLRRGRMMMVDALEQGRERREALRGVPLRCWDAHGPTGHLADALWRTTEGHSHVYVPSRSRARRLQQLSIRPVAHHAQQLDQLHSPRRGWGRAALG